MGPLREVFAKMPMFNNAMADQVEEGELVKVESLIHSMTPAERSDPDLIDKSRASRIARGSGRRSKDVTELIARFGQMREMMSAWARAGAECSRRFPAWAGWRERGCPAWIRPRSARGHGRRPRRGGRQGPDPQADEAEGKAEAGAQGAAQEPATLRRLAAARAAPGTPCCRPPRAPRGIGVISRTSGIRFRPELPIRGASMFHISTRRTCHRLAGGCGVAAPRCGDCCRSP